MGLAGRVDEDREPVDLVGLDEVLGVRRRALADRGEADARVLELLPVAMQLHRVLATERSAVVAQPRQDDGRLRPEVAEADVVAVLVRQNEAGERGRIGRRVRRLLVVAGSEERGLWTVSVVFARQARAGRLTGRAADVR